MKYLAVNATFIARVAYYRLIKPISRRCVRFQPRHGKQSISPEGPQLHNTNLVLFCWRYRTAEKNIFCTTW